MEEKKCENCDKSFNNLPQDLKDKILKLKAEQEKKFESLSPEEKEKFQKLASQYMANNKEIQQEMDAVIKALKDQGINYHTKDSEITGLGDLVETTLNKFGITQERFKAFWGLKECNCTERKKWLNNLFSWHKQSKQ